MLLPLLALVGLGALVWASGDKPKPRPNVEPDLEPRKDTGAPPPSGADLSCVDTNIADVDWVQRRLTRHGFPVSDDGACGPKTRAAIRSFQASVFLSQTGYADEATISALESAPSTAVGDTSESYVGGGMESGLSGISDALIDEVCQAGTKDALSTVAALYKSGLAEYGRQNVITDERKASDWDPSVYSLTKEAKDLILYTYWKCFDDVLSEQGFRRFFPAGRPQYVAKLSTEAARAVTYNVDGGLSQDILTGYYFD